MGKQGQAQAVPAAIKASSSYGGLISNGDFAAGGAGWTAAPGASVVFTGNIATFNAACTLSRPLDAGFYVGAKYTVSFTISGWTAGTVASSVGAGAASPTHGANGSFSDIVTAGSTPQSLALSVAGASVALAVDNIMVTLYALKPIELSAPVLAGNNTPGSVITMTDAAWNEKPAGTSTPQWYEDGVLNAGATGWTYTVLVADFGKTITGRVTRTNSEGSTLSSVSNGIAIPAGTFTPVIAFENEVADPTQFHVTNRTAFYQDEVWQVRVADNSGFTGATILTNDIDAGEATAGSFTVDTSASGTTYVGARVNGGPWSNTLTHNYPSTLFGSGTPAGNVLGSEPDGLAIDHAADQILIRDSTGVKNFLGTYSTFAPANQIDLSSLPAAFSNYFPTSGVFTGTAGATWPGYQVYMDWCNAAHTIYAGVGDAGGRAASLSIAGATVNMNTTNNWADGAPFKLGWRLNTDDAYIILNGNAGAAAIDTTCPSFYPLQSTLNLWRDPTNAAINFNGTKGTVLILPRGMSNSELQAKTA